MTFPRILHGQEKFRYFKAGYVYLITMCSSGMLVTEVLGWPIGPIFKNKTEFFLE
jgi:hypothetical protein